MPSWLTTQHKKFISSNMELSSRAYDPYHSQMGCRWPLVRRQQRGHRWMGTAPLTWSPNRRRQGLQSEDGVVLSLADHLACHHHRAGRGHRRWTSPNSYSRCSIEGCARRRATEGAGRRRTACVVEASRRCAAGQEQVAVVAACAAPCAAAEEKARAAEKNRGNGSLTRRKGGCGAIGGGCMSRRYARRVGGDSHRE
jgi:hypothetical protein